MACRLHQGPKFVLRSLRPKATDPRGEFHEKGLPLSKRLPASIRSFHRPQRPNAPTISLVVTRKVCKLGLTMHHQILHENHMRVVVE
ncbi:hypothetical protein CR513_58634, partial [Mucuna pruriens]